jgi:fibronectin-binding autotransporter adhesin
VRRIKRLLNVVAAGIVSVSSLFVLAPTVHAAADTCTWTGLGGDTNFSTAANWSGCDNGTVPENGDSLVFPFTVTEFTPNNDIVGLNVAGLTFNGVSPGGTACANDNYDITGLGLTLAGNVTISHTGSCDYSVSQGISAPVTVSGTVYVDGSASSVDEGFNLISSTVTGSGSLIARGVSLEVQNVDQSVNLGVENMATLFYRPASCTAPVIASNVSLAGNAKVSVGIFSPCDDFTINNVSLSLDAALDADYADVTIGTLTANGYDLTVQDGSATKVLVNSTTLEGNYVDVTYSANSPGTSVTVTEKSRVTVTGTYGTTTVDDLAYLKGNGTVGALTVNSGGTLAPGMSPGCLNTGILTLAGTYEVEIQGATACSGYDQTNVAGSVNVTGATLNLSTTGFVPTVGQKFVIINNDLADAVVGTFTGLAEGATIVDGGVTYTISYVGGDGNDVELTVTAVDASAIPGAPNTGFALLTANPLATMLGALLAAAGFGLLARRQLGSK